MLHYTRWMALALLLLALVLSTVAQDGLDETYVSADGMYQISYPSGWILDDSDPKFAVLVGRIGSAELAMTIFSPSAVEMFALGSESAVEVAGTVSSVIEFVQDDVEPFPLQTRDAAAASVNLDGQGGVAFVLEMSGGGYGMIIILANSEVLTEQTATLIEIISSYNTPGTAASDEEPAFAGSAPPELLAASSTDWQAITAELEAAGLIPGGGSLVFSESSVIFEGIGSWFTPFATADGAADVLMGGEILFTAGDTDLETCGLLARIQEPGADNPGGSAEDFLEVGINNEGAVYYIDRFSSSPDDTVFGAQPLELALDEPHQLLAIIHDEQLSAYVDGQLAFGLVPIQKRSGYYGIAMLGQMAGSACAGSNLWAYRISPDAPAICEISTTTPANKRSGPGLEFTLVGQIVDSEIIQAVGQKTGSDGLRWWQLADGTWVREDVVETRGECGSLPVAE